MTSVKDDEARGPLHSRAWQWAAVASVALLAWVVRALPVRNVFIDGHVYFTDSDSYYHLRRIAYNLASFPSTLDHDPYLNFPVGAKAIWPQTLDWLLALLVWPFYEAGAEPSYESFLAWVPPALGALTVWAVFRIVATHFGAREAVGASLVLAVLPAHFWYSQVGFLDHHAAVAFTATLLLGSTMGIVKVCVDPPETDAAFLRRGVGLGLLQALNLAIWPGGILYVALAQGPLLGVALFGETPAARKRALHCIMRSSIVAFLAIAPLSLGNEWPQWGPYSAVVLSNFQPWWFAASFLFALISAQAFARVSGATGATRVGIAAVVGGLLIALSAVFLPELGASFTESAQWLGKTDSFQALVGESVPLFVLHGKFTTDIASSRLSYFFYLFPIVVLVCALAWRGTEKHAPLYAFILWAVVLFGFTLLQKRFFNTLSVPLAIAFGIALVRTHDLIRSRLKVVPPVAAISTILLALVLLWPCFGVYRAELRGATQGNEGSPPVRNLRIEANILRAEMTSWLRRNTPPTRSFVNEEGAPEYGVMARWGEGHFISYTARRPAVMGNFGDDLGREHFLLARSFFGATPERAEKILEELDVRYVVIRSMSESRSMAKTLFERDGSRLGRYRLVHEVRPHRGLALPSYKIFEFVPGAELVGTAPARSLVKATLALTTNLGRETQVEAVGLSDAKGRYRVRLPYATGGEAGGLTTSPHYRVTSDGRTVEVAVDDLAVVQGTVVEGPSF